MKILITGITGFVGSHLAELYVGKGKEFEVFGLKRYRSPIDNIFHLEDKICLVEGDLTDAHSVNEVIKKIKPDVIHHLAGQSFVKASWQYPLQTMQTNLLGTINLFEAVRKYCTDAIVQIASSSEVYGNPAEIPITENCPLRPLSPYGVSKAAMDLLGQQYCKSYGLKIVITRAFNHTGPRRGEWFAESNFAKQIVEIEKGKREPVVFVGNLNAKRDYTDVRDIVGAYYLTGITSLLDFGEPYNICSGEAFSMAAVLNMLVKLSTVKVQVEQDLNRLRPSDVEVLQGDCSKFKGATLWKPKISLQNTLFDLLEYWRRK